MKSLFKTTIIILSTVALYTFSGCKSDGYSYIQLRNTKPTHTIQSLDLESKIKTVLTDKKNFEELESEVILLFIQKNKENYEICISRTDYDTFKNYRPDLYNDLKGYSSFQNIPVLLFGNIDKTFFKKNDVAFHNILGKLPEYNIENPPIIYEPRMICDKIQITE